ncbi:MAG: hypothetical protein ACK5AO_00415 [bacterium]
MAWRNIYFKSISIVTLWRTSLSIAMFFLMYDVFGQTERNKKEVINITSSFKPSIVKTGKIEFSASPLSKDLSSYDFVYPIAKTQFSTPMRSFMVRPLAYKSDALDKDTSSVYAKLGYGNLNTPFASLGLKQEFTGSTLSFIADHISSKGNLPDQELQNSSVAVKFRQRIAENQSMDFSAGYDRDAYRLYGFDHSLFSFNSTELKQQFNNIFIGAGYRIITGVKNQATFSPTLRLDLLSASRNVQEQLIKFNLPLSYTISNTWRIHAEPTAELVQLRSAQDKKYSNTLFTVPVFAIYSKGKLQVKAGIIPVSQTETFNVAPDILVTYALRQSGVKVKAGVSNVFRMNSYHSLYGLNPFVLTPDTLTISHTTDYFVGFDFVNAKGFQLRFKTGVIQYQNQPLFYNSSIDGKNLVSISDQSFTALNLEAGVDYSLSRQLSITASVQAFSFADFVGQMKAYGILPLTFSGGISWKPLKALHIKGRVFLWQGAMAKDLLMKDIRLKGAADISMGIEYSLNKKWALWTDLNNIANITYQRWHQYPSFGFHAMGGVRYSIHK